MVDNNTNFNINIFNGWLVVVAVPLSNWLLDNISERYTFNKTSLIRLIGGFWWIQSFSLKMQIGFGIGWTMEKLMATMVTMAKWSPHSSSPCKRFWGSYSFSNGFLWESLTNTGNTLPTPLYLYPRCHFPFSFEAFCESSLWYETMGHQYSALLSNHRSHSLFCSLWNEERHTDDVSSPRTNSLLDG